MGGPKWAINLQGNHMKPLVPKTCKSVQQFSQKMWSKQFLPLINIILLESYQLNSGMRAQCLSQERSNSHWFKKKHTRSTNESWSSLGINTEPSCHYLTDSTLMDFLQFLLLIWPTLLLSPLYHGFHQKMSSQWKMLTWPILATNSKITWFLKNHLVFRITSSFCPCWIGQSGPAGAPWAGP